MKSTMKIALSGAIALSTLTPLTNGALAEEQQGKNLTKHTSQKVQKLNANNYMDKNYDLRKRVFALMSASEDASYDYSKQYRSWTGDYEDGRGYTAGLVGFTSATGDMYDVVKYYNEINPKNPLAKYTDQLKEKKDNHSGNVSGLEGMEQDWYEAFDTDKDNFVKAQNKVIKEEYYQPAIDAAKQDGLSQLGQYIYFDALVKHGPGEDKNAEIQDASFGDLRRYAQENGVKTSANRGDEKTYLSNFVGKNYDATNAEKDAYGEDDDVTDRLDFQKEQIDKANFDLNLPLAPKINGMNDNGEKNILSQEVIDDLNDNDIDFDNVD